jgi:hypothetical protein
MYFTIAPREASSPGLSPEALRSYRTLRVHANALAAFSASFAREAIEAAASYETALKSGSEPSWRAFVERCQTIVDHCNSVSLTFGFNEAERDAWQFFAQIAAENADLLGARVHSAA